MTTALTLTLIAALLACWRLTRPPLVTFSAYLRHDTGSIPQPVYLTVRGYRIPLDPPTTRPEWTLHEALVDVRPWAYLDSDGRVRRATHKEVVPMMGLLRPKD